jgi:hypothetical protein
MISTTGHPRQRQGPAVIDIDGSLHPGSDTIVRQAVVYAALTGQPARVRNARARRSHPPDQFGTLAARADRRGELPDCLLGQVPRQIRLAARQSTR